jgi:hypothetical protein
MADWKHKLSIGDLHEQYQSHKITPQQLGFLVSQRLKALLDTSKPKIDNDLKYDGEELVYRFEHDVETVNDYDSILSDLYDWGDTELPRTKDIPFSMTPKLCWIDTFKK